MHIAEKDLEDWVCSHLPEVVAFPEAQLIGRQITLPSGSRLDVLAALPGNDGKVGLIVIELKAGTADDAALCQLLRYMNELKLAASAAAHPPFGICNERMGNVFGMLAAPDLAPSTAAAIGGAYRITFVRLRVSIEAEFPQTFPASRPPTERVIQLAELLDSAVASAARAPAADDADVAQPEAAHE